MFFGVFTGGTDSIFLMMTDLTDRLAHRTVFYCCIQLLFAEGEVLLNNYKWHKFPTSPADRTQRLIRSERYVHGQEEPKALWEMSSGASLRSVTVRPSHERWEQADGSAPSASHCHDGDDDMRSSEVIVIGQSSETSAELLFFFI